MRKYILIMLSALFIFMSSDIYAQRRNPAKNADLAFGRKQYTEAADRYKKAYRKVRRNKEERNRISFQMAECYRLIGLTKRAEPYYNASRSLSLSRRDLQDEREIQGRH